MTLLFALMLAAVMVLGTTALHYEVIHRLDGLARRAQRSRWVVLGVFSALILLHVVEIGSYAALYGLALGPLQLGHFSGERSMTTLDFFYYAAETYSSLGYGDIYPVGEVRLIASISPLNGILLLAWSGSFLFSLTEDWRGREQRKARELRREERAASRRRPPSP